MVRWMPHRTDRPRSRSTVGPASRRGAGCGAGPTATMRTPSRSWPRVVADLAVGAALLGFVSLQSVGCRAPQFSDADAVAIEAVLTQQREAWNVGDIDVFMAAYLAGPELVFTSGAAVRRGHAEALARYRAKYVDGGTMGQLVFSELEVTGLSADAAVVLGRWALTQTDQAGDGVFTLVFVRREGAWKILHDHTSVTPEPPGKSPPSDTQ